MGDEFDGCEYIWSHQFSMQRLLNFIRQNQNHCSDTQCMDVSGRVLQPATVSPTDSNDEVTNFTMMTMLMVFAVIMYFIRPQSIMKFANSKRSSREQDPHGSPPPPPPPAVN